MSEQDMADNQFSYDGWLVFNELFNTEIFGSEQDSDPEEILDRFSDYTPGSPNDPSSGFSENPFPHHLSEIGDLTYDLQEFANSLYSFQYIDEDWVEEWGFDEEGNEQLFYKGRHDEVDVFWDTESQVMMFRGDQRLLGRKRKAVRSGLTGDIQLDSVEFDFDFFLWVLYKEFKEEELSSDLRVRTLSRGKTIGDREDNLGKRVNVQGSDNILRSLMVIAPLLSGKKLEGLQGTFILGTNQIKAEIEHGGKVHVKVSDSPLSRMDDLRRMGLSLRFLSELVSLFNQWERLDRQEKYPPESFFDELADIAEDEGWDLRYDPREVKEEYRRKRQNEVAETADPESGTSQDAS